MAEPTDRPGPARTGVTPTPPPYPARPAVPVPGAGRADGPEYQPLALAAIVGFCLSAAYAGILVIFCLAAWFSGTPPLLPPWTLLFPLVFLAVSGLGQLQVQRSEGTLAGARLALWGMAVSALFGLSYAAYLIGSFAALRQQAEDFAGKWVNLVRDHDYDEAFRLTLDPASRPRPGPQLRRDLELRFNTGPEGSPQGPMTNFLQSSFVRLLNHAVSAEGGADAEIKPLGVQGWEYKGGGYQMHLIYEVRTPAGSAEVQIGLRGLERKGESGPTREWTILVPETTITRELEVKPLRGRLMELKESSSTFVEDWLKKLDAGRLGDAFLDTQDPGRRPALRAEYGARQAAGTLGLDPNPGRLALVLDPDAAHDVALPGYREFRRGDFVQAPPDTFWADERVRKAVTEATRRYFSEPDGQFTTQFHLLPTMLPLWSQKDGRLRFYHDVMAVVFHRYMVLGRFVTETDAAALEDTAPPPSWRLAALELVTARTRGGDVPPAPAGGPH